MGDVKQKTLMSVKEAYEQALSAGPQSCYARISEFCSDIEQLVQAMQVLFEQDPAVLLVFGVSVKVEVSSKDLGKLLYTELGSEEGEQG